MSQIRVIYKLIDVNFDPDRITSTTKVSPSKVVRKGEVKFPGKSPIVWDKSIWMLEVRVQDESPFAFRSQLDEVFSRLAESWIRFVDFGAQYFCEVSCLVSIKVGSDTGYPSIHLTDNDIRRLDELGACFDIDLYVTEKN